MSELDGIECECGEILDFDRPVHAWAVADCVRELGWIATDFGYLCPECAGRP